MLRARAGRAVAWSAVDLLARTGLGFGFSIALARLLSPSDFGLLAILSLFTAVANIFVGGGMATAIIQKRDITPEDESTAFWMNVIAGISLFALLALSGPLIARFYKQPVLGPLTVLLGLGVLVSALGAIHSTLLAKRLAFVKIMQTGVIATTVSGTVAVWMALHGYGVWALGYQALVASTLTTIGYWLSSGWQPRLVWRWTSARKLYSFGAFMMGSALLDNIYGRLYSVLVARWFGPADVGYYSRADGTQQLPASVLAGIVSRVSLPVFSEAAGDKGKLRRGVQLSLRGLMLLNVPAMMGLAAIAEPVVVGLFGPKWGPSVPVLRILCFSGLFWPVHVINLNVLLAQGHPQAFFRLDIAKKAIGLCFLGVGVPFGIEGVAWSVVAIGVIGLWVNTYYTGRLLGYGLSAQARDIMPVFGSAIPMAVSIFWLSERLAWNPLLQVAILSLAGLVVYVVISKVLRIQALSDAWVFLSPILDRLKR